MTNISILSVLFDSYSILSFWVYDIVEICSRMRTVVVILWRNFWSINLLHIGKYSDVFDSCKNKAYKHYTDTRKYLYLEILTDKFLSQSGIIYMTRVKKERFPNIESYDTGKDMFIFDTKAVKKWNIQHLCIHFQINSWEY